jgi:diketogulonate reductase-like aldo/keto reductase
MTSPSETTTINHQIELPMIGLGTWQATGNACVEAVAFALNHGYSLIDTAQAYNNEKEVGKGWQESGRRRQDVFITTKIHNNNQGYDRSKRSIEKSLANLQTDYVDLLLIHWPDIRNFNKTVETWEALVELQEEGLCRAIGVSNFTIPLLEALKAESDVTPAVNQVEFHPFLYQKNLLTYCQENKIQVEAYSPLTRGKFFNNSVLQRMAQKYGKTPAQIMLAWAVNHHIVVIPKSTHPGRIQENADIFFDIPEEDLAELDALNRNLRLVKGFWAPPTW